MIGAGSSLGVFVKQTLKDLEDATVGYIYVEPIKFDLSVITSTDKNGGVEVKIPEIVGIKAGAEGKLIETSEVIQRISFELLPKESKE